MDSSVSLKDEIWFFARVPSHFNWPLLYAGYLSADGHGVLGKDVDSFLSLEEVRYE